MSVLIIAEKPSLGRNIAAGIGGMQKKDGYLEGGGYIITWAFGHLFSLADIEAYTPGNEPAKRKWTLENLPCFPAEFKYELRRDDNNGKGKRADSGVKKQFEIIKSLCNRPDVDTVVNAGDADREGEIIVRLCIQKALRKAKKYFRLWLPDQTPQTVAQALKSMKPASEYDSLANEGFARTYVDWLYGVNLTRYATIKCGMLLRVGRVIVPIVRAIYERDLEIRNFVPQQYYAVISRAVSNGEEIELVSKLKFAADALADAQAYCDRLNAAEAIVTSVKRKRDKLPPGKLYSLSRLQNVLGKKYKMSMKESLDIVQKLYEKGYLTYPRTNSEYLATAEKDKVQKIVDTCRTIGYNVEFKDKKSIFDDSKIESHSAITPTYKIPDKSKLTEREYQVYSTVFRRFAAMFCAEDCIVERTEIVIDAGDAEQFTLRGMIMLERGWTKYDDYLTKDKILPPLNEGDHVNTDFKPTEKETMPPKHYTIETLNNYLKNPFREEKAAPDPAVGDADSAATTGDDEEYRAIFEGLELGTEATRTGIIDNARQSKYIALTKDVYTILPGGEFLIKSLTHMNISMDKYKTAELGRALKRVYRNEIAVMDSIALAQCEISEVFANQVEAIAAPPAAISGEVVGKCPLCGLDVLHTRHSYSCANYKNGCMFSIYGTLCGKELTENMVRYLLRDGRTTKLKGFKSKAGKKFNAVLKLDNGKVVFDFGTNVASDDKA